MNNFNHLEFSTNSIVSRENIMDDSIKSRVPEGAIYFSGYVSDGEKNRNGYIIASDAWFFEDNRYVNDFLATGSILWNHDSDKPIGRPLSFVKMDDGRIHVTGYVFDDRASEGAIGRGLVLGLSTGHYTHESMMSDENGATLSMDDYWKLPIEEIFSNKWTEKVTKAEIVEFSFVSVRSNRGSTVKKDKVEEYARRNSIDPKQVYSLIPNHNSMENPVQAEAPEVVAEEVVTETVDTPVVEAEPVAEAPESTQAEVLANLAKLVETLSADVAELKSNKVSSSDEDKRAVLAQIVTNATGVQTNDVKTTSDLLAKYKAS